MEHKIGEIVTLPGGRKAEVVEGNSCYGCYLHERHLCTNYYAAGYILNCIPALRTDHKNIIYKEIKEE